MKLVLSGRPGVGKTTVVIKLTRKLESLGIPQVGFYTGELREKGSRVGFEVFSLNLNRKATFAHVDFSSPSRVGKYGVDIRAFEEVAIPSLDVRSSSDVVIIDEIGKMELFSESFRGRVLELFHSSNPILATIPLGQIQFVDNLIKETNPRDIRIDEKNRNSLPEELVSLLRHLGKLN